MGSFNWVADAIRNPKIIDARLDAEFGGIAFDISKFGPVGTSNDLATFQAAVTYAASYGSRIGIRMRPAHTLVDNTASDGASLLISTDHVYFLAADGGTVITLQSSSTDNRIFFHWIGSLGSTYSLNTNAAADATQIVLTSGTSWASGDFILVLATDSGGNARSFLRQIHSVVGATLTLDDCIPFGILTTDTLTIYRIPDENFVEGGGFMGRVHFECSGVTGNNVHAVTATITKQWGYDDLSFDDMSGSTPASGATGALYLNVGYENFGKRLVIKNSGSANTSDITLAYQCFGIFGDIIDDDPAGFGPTIGFGSRCSFGHIHVAGAQSTRSFKIQGGVQHHISSVDISSGADTGLYNVIGSDGTQIGTARVHKCVGYGCVISGSNQVQIGCLDARANGTDLYTDSGTTNGQIGVAEVTDISKVNMGGTIDIGKLHDITNDKTHSYEKGVIVGSVITYSPTLASQTPGGTPPTLTTNAATYTRYGKQIVGTLFMTVTAAGTGTGYISFTLPVTASGFGGVLGREQAATGAAVTGALVDANTMLFNLYDGTTPITTGRQYNIKFFYDAAAYA